MSGKHTAEHARREDDEVLTLRPAGEADSELLWTWANDPGARSASFHSEPIPWDEHVVWFRRRTTDRGSCIYIVEASERPVGVVRFERKGTSNAVVSVNVAPAARGRGIGSKALRDACERASKFEGISSVTAYIKPDNLASLRTFERADFVRVGTTKIDDLSAIVMTWTPDADR